MALTPGTRIGSYEVAVLIGVGGMGEVYRGTDTNLSRQVAIKVLPEAVASDADRLARFDREARTLAALNHPNIAHVYGLERSGGQTALVMELVEGPTLADRIAQGPIPVDEALAIARQIAEGLEAAHEQGIVHRDLKPANVKVRPDGTVKVLDFGLAKALDPAVGSPGQVQSMSPTITTPAMTQAGLILGTAAYMSPEQARGKPVDRRADIWAFGCVLYEMLTGRRAFEGDDVAATLADVIRADPDWTRLPQGLSPFLVAYLKRCFAKDPGKRVRDIGDLRLALEGAFDVAIPAADAPQPVRATRGGLLRSALPWVAGIALGLAAGLTMWPLRPAPDVVVERFDVIPAGRLDLGVPGLAISPDATRLVYAADGQLFLHSFEQGESVPIRGSEGGAAPFFSPDGESIGFFTRTELKKVPLVDGLVSTLTRTARPGLRGTWSDDGTIVYGIRGYSSLFRVADTGAGAGALTTRAADDLDHDYPSFLPDGRSLLFTYGWFPWNQAEVRVASLDTGDWTVVHKGGFFPQYLETGHLVYVQNGNLWAVPFDASRLEVTGSPAPVVPDVWQMGTGAQFAVSRSGTLAYVPGRHTADAFSAPVWVDRATGAEEPLGFALGFYTDIRLSPDGERLAYSLSGVDNVDVWIWDFADRTPSKLTFDEGIDDAPLWTGDGQRIVFRSTRDGGGLFWRAANGTGEAEKLTDGERPWPFAWSADDRILFTDPSGDQRDIETVEAGGDRARAVVLGSRFNEARLDVSPDGQWLAYESDENGSTEIWVRPLADVDSDRTQVSAGGGTNPRWSADGRELFYLGPTHMMATRVETEPSFSRRQPEELFDITGYVLLADEWANTYDVSRDGTRFLMIREFEPTEEEGASRHIRVVRNWTEELERLVPTN